MFNGSKLFNAGAALPFDLFHSLYGFDLVQKVNARCCKTCFAASGLKIEDRQINFSIRSAYRHPPAVPAPKYRMIGLMPRKPHS